MKNTLDEAMNTIRTSVHDLHEESVDLYAQVYKLVKSFNSVKLNLIMVLKAILIKR